jgi:hypothetical protein
MDHNLRRVLLDTEVINLSNSRKKVTINRTVEDSKIR